MKSTAEGRPWCPLPKIAERVRKITSASVDGQDLPVTGAAAGATDVGGIAGGRLHHDFKASRSSDHGGGNVDCELRTADHGGGESGAIEDHNGGGNEMAASRGDNEAGRQLCKDHRCGRDRVEHRYGASAPAEGIQSVAPEQEQEHDQQRTDEHGPK